MYYYEVWVSGQRFHGHEPLTYQSTEELTAGNIVLVPLQKRKALGVIKKSVNPPKFATKEIIRLITPQPLPSQSLQLLQWLQAYYPAPDGILLSLLLPAGLLQEQRASNKEQETKSKDRVELPPLTGEQAQAVKQIAESDARTVLIHGDTGTGKTRVYLDLIAAQVEKGKSAVVLTPEIGLTPQLEQELQASFPGRAIVLHSNMTAATRRDTWLKLLHASEPKIVIGPRSSLFSPLANIGIIIIDESHDTAYKQEQAPYYQTSRVAAKLASLHGAKMILGSATPLVADYFTLTQKSLPIIRMKEPAIKANHAAVDVKVINLRDNEQFTRSNWLSKTLLEALQAMLAAGNQSLVFLNRRGTARLVLCANCGWQALCPRCDLPLTYHGDTHGLRCHTCGYQQAAPAVCPDCSSTDIVFRSVGTKTLVTELERLFPRARIARFDSDTQKSERLEERYASIAKGEVDIIVGTQMLGKGLDLPKLGLVGIVVADTGLYFPDFTAEERTFQMLTQVMGRVGRGHVSGQVVIQTYHPDSPLIRAAIDKDYDGFYESQIKERQTYNFPPFCYMLKLSCSRTTRKGAQSASEKLAATLTQQFPSLHLSGPSPAFIEKSNDKFTWQILLRSSERNRLLKVLEVLPANWTYDIDPMDLL